MTEVITHDPVHRAREFWQEANFGKPDTYELMSSIYRLNQSMISNIEHQLKEFGLNPTNYFALIALVMRGDHGLPLGQLARNIKVHQTTVTMVLDQLSKLGLVRREPHPRDRRVILAVATPAGRALAKSASDALVDINFGLPELSEAKRHGLINLLGTVRELSGDFNT